MAGRSAPSSAGRSVAQGQIATLVPADLGAAAVPLAAKPPQRYGARIALWRNRSLPVRAMKIPRTICSSLSSTVPFAAIVTLALAASALIGGCAGSQRYEPQATDYAEEPPGDRGFADQNGAPGADESVTVQAERPVAMPQRAPQPVAVHASESYAKKSQVYSGGSSASTAKPTTASTGGALVGKAAKGQVNANAPEPMVVYLGYLRLRVKRQLEAVDAITALTRQFGGYVDSLSGKALVVRVPAKDFDSVMAAFANLGEVLDRRVKALDVSRQFTDTRARLAIAQDARTRLLVLLRTVKDVEERLQILEEIKRLTEQIEMAESVLATLRNLADYFTITIELEPVIAQSAPAQHRSPFPWVRELSPLRATLEQGKKAIHLQVPAGFVQFEDDSLWRAQAADTAMLRAALTDNEPRGDGAFWLTAVQHEMEGRDFETVESAVVGQVHLRVWRSKDVRPSYYLVGVATVADKIAVMEGFLPNEPAFTAHRQALIDAAASLQVTP